MEAPAEQGGDLHGRVGLERHDAGDAHGLVGLGHKDAAVGPHVRRRALVGHVERIARTGCQHQKRQQGFHEDVYKRQLVILDLMLPGVDGMTVCIHIRNQLRSRVPIVMLTAKSEIDTKISAFDIGADDYMIKPVSLREIHVRVRALIRRANQTVDNDILTIGDLRMDTGIMKIERDGVPITLPPGPTKILALLMRNSRCV